nr:immunoglobulin heavy chain junction region [Macaca mulatta]MOV41295.1 immunoglobulin heavy chain junction region [Macaca mulatta]MOV42653.1 immunoglobulin heavy chain junction region [Macaca mulatta]
CARILYSGSYYFDSW